MVHPKIHETQAHPNIYETPMGCSGVGITPFMKTLVKK